MKVSARSPAKRDQLHEAILAHAAALLAEGGLEALTTRELGRRVKATTRVVYSHFGGLPQVVTAVYERAFTSLRDTLTAASQNVELDSALTALARAYRGFALGNTNVFELMYGARAAELIPKRDDRSVATASLEPLIRIFSAHGRSRPTALADAYAFWAAIHGPVALEVSRWIEGPQGFEKVLTIAVAAFGKGHEAPS